LLIKIKRAPPARNPLWRKKKKSQKMEGRRKIG